MSGAPDPREDPPEPAPRPRSRREVGLAILGAGATAGLAAMVALRGGDRGIETRPLSRPAGFRRLAHGGGGASGAGGAGAALIGIEAGFGGAAAPENPLNALGPEAFCAALFPAPVPPGAVRAAVLTDHRCPYCRVLDQRLAELASGPSPALALTVHHWPALGPASETMARLAIAAKAQGKGAQMDALLWESRFPPGAAWIDQAAARLELSAARLRADMRSAATDAALARSRDLARLFGFVGTPGLVIGRTSISGAADMRVLEAVIAAERAEGPPPGCAGAA